MPDTVPQEHSDLALFGEELRREREIRGISLKEIADATKISRRFLEAIEKNDHRTLPAPVFTRGFVREYARYLGLNAEEIVGRYNQGAAGDDRIEKTTHLERLMEAGPLRERARAEIPPFYARIDPKLYGLVLIVAALAGIIWWAVTRKHELRKEAEVSSRSAAIPSRPAPRFAPTPRNAGVGVPSPSAGGMLHLVMVLDGDSWVELDVDGKLALSTDMKEGDRRTFDAHDSFHFRTIGNAAGVSLTLNDVRIPQLGPEGKVVHDRVLDRETLKSLAAEVASPRSNP